MNFTYRAMNIFEVNKKHKINTLCNSNRGSLTVEATVVLVLYMLAIISLISLMEIIKSYQDIEMNLYRASKEMSLYYAGKDMVQSFEDSTVKAFAETILAKSYAQNIVDNQLYADYQSTNVLVGGVQGVSLDYSSVGITENDIIDLVATYEASPLCNAFNISPFSLVNRCRVHTWTGFSGRADDNENDGERIVYITDTGNVFHLTRSCTYISLSISATSLGEVSSLRNMDGGKYKSCEICGSNPYSEDTLYITNQGDRYHTSLTCSGLKRTVNAIPISEVGERSACSRCGG